MTNADIPTIAIKNVLKNAKNPYTNELINNKEKEKGIFIKNDNIWYIKHYKNKTKILEDVDIINYVKGNPKEKTNWITNMTYKEALKLYKNLDNK